MPKPVPGPATKKIIELIKRRLEELGLSPVQAAKQAGLPHDSIRYVLNGSSPSIDRLHEIEQAIGINILNLDNKYNEQNLINFANHANTELPRIWSMGALPDIPTMENRLKEFNEWSYEAVFRAEQLLAESLEADTLRMVAIAFRAIEISPLCAEAYLDLANLLHVTPEEEIFLVNLAVDAGMFFIHPETFKSHRGYFWDMPEIRPYMKARFHLAEIYRLQGDLQQALRDYQELLELDKGDSMGCRYRLAACLLGLNDKEGLLRLIDQFQAEISTHMLYTRTLVQFMQQGRDDLDARRLAKEAWSSNAHVPGLLIAYTEAYKPEDISAYRAGSEDEAENYLSLFGSVWSQTSGAIEWLLKATRSSRETMLDAIISSENITSADDD